MELALLALVALGVLAMAEGGGGGALDVHIPAETAQAVAVATTTNDPQRANPQRLTAFALTLKEAGFPLASAAVQRRASALAHPGAPLPQPAPAPAPTGF